MSSEAPSLPQLREVSLSRPIPPPEKKIRDDRDVDEWKRTTGYKDYCLWVVRLNSSVIGCDIPTVSALEKSEVHYI
jgi:serine/threonine-protein phosphatase 2A activator